MVALTAGYARFDGHAVADLQCGHLLAQLSHHAGGLVANNHGLSEHKVANASVCKVVYIRAANANTIHGQENL